MATSRKRGNSYTITVSMQYDSSGKQRRVYKTWVPPEGLKGKRLETELERQKVLFEEEVRQGKHPLGDGKMHFSVFAEKWLTEYAEQELKPKTVDGYTRLLERTTKAIGEIRLKDMKANHLKQFYNNLKEEGINQKTERTWSEFLDKKRKAANLSKDKLAALSGVSSATVWAACKGDTISAQSAKKISKAMNIDDDKLFHVVPSDRKLSPNTIRAYHRMISSILSKAVEWEYIPFNPAKGIKLPKMSQKEAPHLDESTARELLRLLHEEPIKYRAMITFDLLSGLRRGELLGLRWQDVDFNNEIIYIVQTYSYTRSKGVYLDTPKNETSKRIIRLSKTAFGILREYKAWQDGQRETCENAWLDTDGRVFTHDDGRPVHPDSLSSWFRDFITRTKLPKVTIHSLRHTYASLMIAEGIPLVAVSKKLGHAQVSTTSNIYSHAIAKTEEKAAQVQDKFADVIQKRKY